LKGSVSNFFAPVAMDACQRLETRGRAGDLAGAEKDCRDLDDAIDLLRGELDRLAQEIESTQNESNLVQV